MHCNVSLRSRILFCHKMLLSFIDVVFNVVATTTTSEATTTTPTTTTEGNVHEFDMYRQNVPRLETRYNVNLR